MSNEIEQKESKRIGWGVKVPLLSLAEVIEIVKITYSKAGDTGSLDVLSRITGNSSSSSTFAKKISALKNFGVFIIDKSTYTLTELGLRIAQPESFEQQATAIIEAFLNQEYLKKIWENYKGKRLPQEEYLANSIVNILAIPQELKIEWATYFISAGKYSGLLEERESGFQVLLNYTSSTPISNVPIKKENEEQITPILKEAIITQPTSNDSLNIEGNQWGILSKKNVSGNRKAIFAIPEDLTQQDIEALRIVIKGIDIQLDGLKKNEE
jgi:hypothetical protein